MLLNQNPRKTVKPSQKNLEVLANISHEIRNPLNAIIGLAHLLQAPTSEEDQKVYVDSLMETSQTLLELINNIMDFSKVEVGNFELLPEPTDLKKTITQNLLGQKAIAEQGGLIFNLKIDKRIPDFVKVDSVKVIQVLLNLVSNAIKFTESGAVKVGIEVGEILEDKVQINFKVIDSGIGIPIEKQQSIFEAFDQGSEEINRVYGGTGLGLSISRTIVEAMGGTLTLQSEPGKGSEFSFSLNFEIHSLEKIISRDVEQQLATLQKERIKVLIVDDNKLNILIVQKYLEIWGWNYDIAYNGLEAVEKVQNQNFDMVLMDLHMPEMDGLKAIGIIRKLEGCRFKNLPIIGLTASVEKFVEEKVYSAGFTDLLTKPFKPEDLLEKVKYHTSQDTYLPSLLA